MMLKKILFIPILLSFSSLSYANQNKLEQKNAASFFGNNPETRVAVRLGLDSTRQEVKRDFMSLGVEGSILNTQSPYRQEAGVKVTTSLNDVKISSEKVNGITAAYGFIGAGVKDPSGFTAGARLLVGGEWIDIGKNISQQDQFAVGGEARVGYGWDNNSLFLSYALTEHLQMFGVDFGVNI